VKEYEKQVSSFSLENEINKITIPIPLVELMKTDPFRKSVLKALHPHNLVLSSEWEVILYHLNELWNLPQCHQFIQLLPLHYFEKEAKPSDLLDFSFFWEKIEEHC